MSTATEKHNNIASRIRAMLAMTPENGASVEEAKTAARLVARLMHKYAISQAELDAQCSPGAAYAYDISTIHRVTPWTQMLSGAVERMFPVSAMVQRPDKHLFCGRAVSRELARATFEQLVVRLQLAERTEDGGHAARPARPKRQSWLLGAAIGVYEAVNQAAPDEGDTQALVIMQDERDAIGAWVRNDVRLRSPRKPRLTLDADAYNAGHAHGRAMRVHPMVQGGPDGA